MFFIYIVISIILLLIVFLHRRINGINTDIKTISLLEMSEFDDLDPKLKAFYKEVILESWIKGINAAINSEYEKSGIDKYYTENQEQVVKLNKLYLEIAKISFKNKNVTGDFKLLMYNANLDRLIQDAEAKLVELRAMNDAQVKRI
jgi:hypothetical protein